MASPAKSFDIEHPTKGKGHRLRYVSLEGPEIGVYVRGVLKGDNVKLSCQIIGKTLWMRIVSQYN